MKQKYNLRNRELIKENILTLKFARENFDKLTKVTGDYNKIAKYEKDNHYVYINVGHYSKEIFNIGYGTKRDGVKTTNKSKNYTYRKRGDGADTYVIFDNLSEKDARKKAEEILEVLLIHGNMVDLYII